MADGRGAYYPARVPARRTNLSSRVRRLARRFGGSFRRDLERPDAPLSLDMRPRSGTLLVAFGGMRGELGMPPFEFFKAAQGLAAKKLFVRDLRQAWYHRGIPGHGATLEECAAALRELIDGAHVERLVVAGNSAGGYAAMILGSLMEADVALCFAPQTVLDLGVLADMDDHRWDEQLRELLEAGVIDGRYVDVRSALADAPSGRTAFEVYFDEDFDVDRLHAERVGAVAGVTLHPLRGGKHGIARDMRESGQLDRVLRAALTDARDAAAASGG
jgi:hypothetical protein